MGKRGLQENSVNGGERFNIHENFTQHNRFFIGEKDSKREKSCFKNV